jgi:NADH-quinone oxidoreductase subunit L
MYSTFVMQPYRALTRWLRHEPIDDGIGALTGAVRLSHYLLVLTQSGRLRTYAAGMVLGALVLLLSWLWG